MGVYLSQSTPVMSLWVVLPNSPCGGNGLGRVGSDVLSSCKGFEPQTSKFFPQPNTTGLLWVFYHIFS